MAVMKVDEFDKHYIKNGECSFERKHFIKINTEDCIECIQIIGFDKMFLIDGTYEFVYNDLLIGSVERKIVKSLKVKTL